MSFCGPREVLLTSMSCLWRVEGVPSGAYNNYGIISLRCNMTS